jgi:hypothetical protein
MATEGALGRWKFKWGRVQPPVGLAGGSLVGAAEIIVAWPWST